jgi:hypothetical protein
MQGLHFDPEDIWCWSFQFPWLTRKTNQHAVVDYARRPGSYRLPSEPTLFGEIVVRAFIENA